MIISQFKYAYDEMINPEPTSISPFWGISQVDIIRGNNPIYSYYYNAVMSSFPPQYEFTYEYDKEGLPIKGYRKNLQQTGSSAIIDYEYIDKNE